MVIFDKDKKNLSIPKGLGNVAVAISSGNTDTVTPQELDAKAAEVKTYARLQAAQANREATRSANAYTDNAVSAITADTDKYVIISPNAVQYWDYFSADFTNAILDRADALGNNMTRLKILICGFNYGIYREFSVSGYIGGVLYIYWTGIDYSSISGGERKITCNWLQLRRDTAVEQGDIYEFYIENA